MRGGSQAEGVGMPRQFTIWAPRSALEASPRSMVRGPSTRGPVPTRVSRESANLRDTAPGPCVLDRGIPTQELLQEGG